jgi:hypothetical protein
LTVFASVRFSSAGAAFHLHDLTAQQRGPLEFEVRRRGLPLVLGFEPESSKANFGFTFYRVLENPREEQTDNPADSSPHVQGSKIPDSLSRTVRDAFGGNTAFSKIEIQNN